MFYWISYKKPNGKKWEYCEEQFYPYEKDKILPSINAHWHDGWQVNYMKRCNMGENK